MVQGLGLHASTAGGMGSIPCWGTKIPQAAQHGHRKKKKEHVWLYLIVSSAAHDMKFVSLSVTWS